MRTIPSCGLIALAFSIILCAICGCSPSDLAQVPNFSNMSDSEEFEDVEETTESKPMVATPNLSNMVSSESNKHTSNPDLPASLYAAVTISLLLIATLLLKLAPSLVRNSPTQFSTKEIPQPNGNLTTQQEMDSSSTRTDLSDQPQTDSLENIEPDPEDSFVLALNGSQSPPPVGSQQLVMSPNELAIEQNQQLKLKLREKLATIKNLEFQLERLKEKVASISNKNEKLKTKLREKIAIIRNSSAEN